MYYERIAKAIKHYTQLGYEWIDTPWVVSDIATKATFDFYQTLGTRERLGYDLGNLVGSAEQGFVQLMLDGKLKHGRYVSAGPCFRFSDRGKSKHHHPWFFKVELIDVGETNYKRLLADAMKFFFAPCVNAHNIMLQVNDTMEGQDISLAGLEIGSYGTRKAHGFEWSYGTGLAEPRFSEAIKNR